MPELSNLIIIVYLIFMDTYEFRRAHKLIIKLVK